MLFGILIFLHCQRQCRMRENIFHLFNIDGPNPINTRILSRVFILISLCSSHTSSYPVTRMSIKSRHSARVHSLISRSILVVYSFILVSIFMTTIVMKSKKCLSYITFLRTIVIIYTCSSLFIQMLQSCYTDLWNR